MKQKSTSQSAFFNLRVLIGLFVVLTGVFLAVIGLGTFSGLTASSAKAQQAHKIINVAGLPPGFDCATIHEKGIDRMENLGAGLILIACGESPGGSATSFGAFSQLFNAVTLYHTPPSTFFAVFIATGCGGQGLGSWKSIDGGVTWTVGACVHTGGLDDRESGVADNNPSSPFFGRMYVSWNDFTVGVGALKVRYSTDNGATWPNERTLANTNTFIRDTQITVDKITGDVYVAGMNEGGGGLAGPRSNKIYRSTDGGNTWTNTFTGANFAAPGRANYTANPYFVCMYSPDTWRHMRWAEPAAYNGVVRYVYAQHAAGSDAVD